MKLICVYSVNAPLISGIRIRLLASFLTFIFCLMLVTSQECTDTVTVGSLSHDDNIVTADQTFILADYTLHCSGTVVAWEFCYQVLGISSATFYPGIWRITGTRGGNADYELVQSNNVTYDQSVRDPQDATNEFPCQIFNISDIDQFTAPAESVVGLYSDKIMRPQLLHTNNDNSITTYKFSGNSSNVSIAGNSDNFNYNIAIRVHLVTNGNDTAIPSISPPVDGKPNTGAATTSSTTTPVMPTSASSGDSSSGSGGVVAGVVVTIVVIIIVVIILVILVLLYKRRQKRNNKGVQDATHYATPTTNLDYKSREPKELSEHHYSKVGRKQAVDKMVTIKDDMPDCTTADNPGYYSSPSNLNNHKKPIEILEYMDPSSTVVKVCSKASSDDYEAILPINEYETPHFQLSKTPYYYQISASSISANNTGYSTSRPTLPLDEQIYEDPGHEEGKIYAWFEEKKFRKINRNNIQVLQELGSGEFGVVNLGLWSNGSTDPVQVAVKTLNSQSSESDRVKFLREAAIMGQFKHKNVVRLHGVVMEKEHMMIVLEYMSKGDLRNFLMDLKITSPDVCNNLKHDLLSYCRQIAEGMNYLACKQFVHRDLAARNILVSTDDVCKIADFGMARDVADDTYYVTSGGKIPVKWTAPEALLYKKFSVQSDVWSFGCVMYEIWSLGHKPFMGLSGREYVQKITTGYRLPPPPGCPRAIYELMIQCWHFTAKSRPTSESLLETLQKFDRALLTSPVHVTGDDTNQSMMLGAPLDEGSQLYFDLQQSYTES